MVEAEGYLFLSFKAMEKKIEKKMKCLEKLMGKSYNSALRIGGVELWK